MRRRHTLRSLWRLGFRTIRHDHRPFPQLWIDISARCPAPTSTFRVSANRNEGTPPSERERGTQSRSIAMAVRVLAFVGLVLGFIPAMAFAGERPVVVELFTSQGCSSCPPANAFLNEISRGRSDVLPLAFHVTYWDRLGWKDPFSLEAATMRQDSYGHRFGDGSYTPEMVVDGMIGLVGSYRDEVNAAIEHVKRGSAHRYGRKLGQGWRQCRDQNRIGNRSRKGPTHRVRPRAHDENRPRRKWRPDARRIQRRPVNSSGRRMVWQAS